MGGGGGKGGGGGTSGSRALEQIAQQFAQESAPLRQEVLGSLVEILTGTTRPPLPAAAGVGTGLAPGIVRAAGAPTVPSAGGPGARLPLVQQATEQSLAATSQALRALEESPGFAQLAGTPFGERLRADTLLAGRQATAGVPTRLFEAFFPTAANVALGTGGTVVSGLGGAAASQASLAGARARSEGDILTGLLGLGAGAGAGAAAKGGGAAAKGGGAATAGTAATFGLACWIADSLYGVGSRSAELARLWIFHGWCGPVAACVRWAYRRYGKRIAARIDRGDAFSERLRTALLPHFDRAVELAKQYLYDEWLRSQAQRVYDDAPEVE